MILKKMENNEIKNQENLILFLKLEMIYRFDSNLISKEIAFESKYVCFICYVVIGKVVVGQELAVKEIMR